MGSEVKNAQYLSALSLGELGALIEFSVHNDMHMRWASSPHHPKTGEAIPSGRADGDIRDFWDDPNYDFLGEFYSSHVNPIFWRLHGWVDDRINDWFRSHEAAHPGEVVKNTVQNVEWFKKGKWVHTDSPWAGPAHDHGHGEHERHDDDIEKMKKIMEIMFGPSPSEITERAFTVSALRALSVGEPRATHLTWF